MSEEDRNRIYDCPSVKVANSRLRSIFDVSPNKKVANEAASIYLRAIGHSCTREEHPMLRQWADILTESAYAQAKAKKAKMVLARYPKPPRSYWQGDPDKRIIRVEHDDLDYNPSRVGTIHLPTTVRGAKQMYERLWDDDKLGEIGGYNITERLIDEYLKKLSREGNPEVSNWAHNIRLEQCASERYAQEERYYTGGYY